jgi:hypothetical protein
MGCIVSLNHMLKSVRVTLLGNGVSVDEISLAKVTRVGPGTSSVTSVHTKGKVWTQTCAQEGGPVKMEAEMG